MPPPRGYARAAGDEPPVAFRTPDMPIPSTDGTGSGASSAIAPDRRHTKGQPALTAHRESAAFLPKPG